MSMQNERSTFVGIAAPPAEYISWITKAKNIGFNSIFISAKPPQIVSLKLSPANDYWKPALQHLHDLGMKCHYIVNASKYAWTWTWSDTNNDGIKDKWVRSYTFDTFHLKQHNPVQWLSEADLVNPNINPNVPIQSETIPYEKCMEDLDFMLNYHMIDSNGNGLDGIHIEEPYIHYVPTNPEVSQAARTFYNNWFSVGDAETPGIRSLIGENRIENGFDYGWNHATFGLSSIYQMGTDLEFINTHPTFTYFLIQNAATEYDKTRTEPPITTSMPECYWGSPITNFSYTYEEWKRRLTSMLVMNCVYIISSSIYKSIQCGKKWAGAPCFNQNTFNYINYMVQNNLPIYVFLMEYMEHPRSNFQIDSPAGDTSGEIIKTIFEATPGCQTPNHNYIITQQN